MSNDSVSILAPGEYMFSPGFLYIKTTPGFIPEGYAGANGEGILLGRTSAITIALQNTKVELMSSQEGAGRDDAAISYQMCRMETALREPNNEILQAVLQGTYLEKDTSDRVKRVWWSDRLGQRDRAIAFQATFVEIDDGAQAWDQPSKIIDFFVVAPNTEEAAFEFGTENQREVACAFYGYKSRTIKDPLNRSAFFATREEDFA